MIALVFKLKNTLTSLLETNLLVAERFSVFDTKSSDSPIFLRLCFTSLSLDFLLILTCYIYHFGIMTNKLIQDNYSANFKIVMTEF